MTVLKSRHFKRKDWEISIEISRNIENILSTIIFIAENWREVFITVNEKAKEKVVKLTSKIGQVAIISHHSQDFGVCVHWKIGDQEEADRQAGQQQQRKDEKNV